MEKARKWSHSQHFKWSDTITLHKNVHQNLKALMLLAGRKNVKSERKTKGNRHIHIGHTLLISKKHNGKSVNDGSRVTIWKSNGWQVNTQIQWPNHCIITPERKDYRKAYPRQVSLYKKLTTQSSALVCTKHLFQNLFWQTKEMSATVLGQHVLHSTENNKTQTFNIPVCWLDGWQPKLSAQRSTAAV